MIGEKSVMIKVLIEGCRNTAAKSIVNGGKTLRLSCVKDREVYDAKTKTSTVQPLYFTVFAAVESEIGKRLDRILSSGEKISKALNVEGIPEWNTYEGKAQLIVNLTDIDYAYGSGSNGLCVLIATSARCGSDPDQYGRISVAIDKGWGDKKKTMWATLSTKGYERICQKGWAISFTANIQSLGCYNSKDGTCHPDMRLNKAHVELACRAPKKDETSTQSPQSPQPTTEEVEVLQEQSDYETLDPDVFD